MGCDGGPIGHAHRDLQAESTSAAQRFHERESDQRRGVVADRDVEATLLCEGVEAGFAAVDGAEVGQGAAQRSAQGGCMLGGGHSAPVFRRELQRIVEPLAQSGELSFACYVSEGVVPLSIVVGLFTSVA
jgi:hypothetical protein